MLLFNPVTTQNRVFPSGESPDWGALHSIDFFIPSHQSKWNPYVVPSPPKNESPTENMTSHSWKYEIPSQEMIPGKKTPKLSLISLFHF